MQLPEHVHQRLADEFRFAVDQMQKEDSPFRKLYFFSVFFGEASRALNWSWDKDLVLIHEVCQQAHQKITARLSAIASRSEQGVALPPSLFERLTQLASELADYISDRDEVDTRLYDLLAGLAELAYASTGNGYYLYTRGTLKL